MPEESETLPLLGDSIGVSDASLLSSSTLVPNSNGEDNKIFSMPTNPHLKKVVVIIACLVVVADMSDFIRIAPKLRIFESSICRDYYRVHDPSVIGSDGNVPESLCKIGEVQSDLALLNGWLNVVQNVPSMLRFPPQRRELIGVRSSGCDSIWNLGRYQRTKVCLPIERVRANIGRLVGDCGLYVSFKTLV